ncbi:MrcB family domain-containing protein [Bacillus sp. N9]
MKEMLRPLFIQIMNAYVNARREPFKEHSLGRLLRTELPELIKNHFFFELEGYEVKGSIGQGNWAVIPWLAIMNPKVTTSTQRGYYIVYLFSEDMKHLYLTFAQGVTESTKVEMEKRNEDIREK